MSFTHRLLDLEVEFEAGHPAWNAFEEQTGQSILDAIQLRNLFAPGFSLLYKFEFALCRKWRARHAPGWDFETFLDALPSMGTELWVELRTKTMDEVTGYFYAGTTWKQLLEAVDRLAEEAEKKAQKVIDG